jgi:hypothetical protein
MMHFVRKLGRTLGMLTCLFMARMFGQYRHSGWDGVISYARYSWFGYEWIFPTSAVESASLPQAERADP